MGRMVMGVNDWAEADQCDFVMCVIMEGETDEDAILRAQSYYSKDQECYIVDESGEPE